jgi:uncharacterized protein YajQ (UPF0234 family)
MPSFDIVSKPDLVEVRNAVDQANKEITNRFDFKGSDARVELKEYELAAFGDDEFKLGQVRDVLIAKLARRSVDLRFVDQTGRIEKIGGDQVRQVLKVRNGVDQPLAKKIVQLIKDARLKATASIQGDAVRVTSAKRDTLQDCIALIRTQITDAPLQFDNFRD